MKQLDVKWCWLAMKGCFVPVNIFLQQAQLGDFL